MFKTPLMSQAAYLATEGHAFTFEVDRREGEVRVWFCFEDDPALVPHLEVWASRSGNGGLIREFLDNWGTIRNLVRSVRQSAASSTP